MKKSLETRFPREKLFSLPGIFDKWKKRFSLTGKTVSTRSNESFRKNWLPHNFNNGCY